MNKHDQFRALLHSIAQPIVFDIGAHKGEDSILFADYAHEVHAFECDPRNSIPSHPRIKTTYKAISDNNGKAKFRLSNAVGHEWAASSTLMVPKKHLEEHLHINFDTEVEVETITLDTYCESNRIERIDLIHADVQGAEELMIKGGQIALSKTLYLYTEYSNQEDFECQPNLQKILQLLPGNWEIIAQPDPWNVLLQNLSPVR